jgi:DHA1 family bicyclomycin/chloramphenicol resistance-like MFS transporter
MTKSEPSRKRIIWILGVLATISPITIDMYLPAFAQIAEDFHSTTAQVSLSVASYFIGLAIGQIIYGPMLDRFGRKKPLYTGLVIFVIACIGCLLSPSVESLIVARFIQALGGCVAWTAALTMVRDFFPAKESVRVFSLLILVIGVSPLLAPTVGGFIITTIGWEWVFVLLAVIVIFILLITFLFLPEGAAPDVTVSLKVAPMLATFVAIFKHPQFYTYALAGAFSFATLFIYVAGSPIIFMELFHVSPKAYGGLFALLSVGFIGGSQVNIFLVRKYSSEKIFHTALVCQVITAIVFLIGVVNGWFGLIAVIILFFILLSCVGLINPNASALSLAPFTKNIGSASSLIAFLQIGIAALASTSVGFFNHSDTIPIMIMVVSTSLVALLIMMAGKRKIGNIQRSAVEAGNVLH